MWKKLTLIRLLVASGVPLLSGLYEEYEALLRDHVRSQREVCGPLSDLTDQQ